MKFRTLLALAICSFVPVSGLAQELQEDSNIQRPRVIVPEATPPPEARPPAKKIVVVTDNTKEVTDEKPAEKRPVVSENSGARVLRFGEIRQRIEEAKRQMRSKPLRTSLVDEEQATDVVRVGFLNWKSDELDYVVLTKQEFLSKDTQSIHKSENGNTVRVQTIRGNGVNTPLNIYDMNNEPLQPLIVQYPRDNKGKFVEMAYYVSTHPGIVTPEVVNVGRIYVRNVLNSARQKLSEKGHRIDPSVVDIAERLALVEHVDHWRFRNEPPQNIFNDVYVLYALNEGQTYRYSVSSAGAGGMVQMIPWTYRMIRDRYPGVGLMPDFVEGMRNHVNASQAMLLYMQMTWSDLSSSDTVKQAMSDGIATQEQLMAAGYNSNPARIPGYIKRGGENWTTLIPRETKIYLQIYESVERHVPQRPREN